jgi:hypothetical protein
MGLVGVLVGDRGTVALRHRLRLPARQPHEISLAALPQPQVSVRVLDAGLAPQRGRSWALPEAVTRPLRPIQDHGAPGTGELLQAVRDAEQDEPGGHRWPWRKRHDDATAILCRFMDPSTSGPSLYSESPGESRRWASRARSSAAEAP